MSAGGDEGNPYAAPRVAVDLVEPRPADADMAGFRALTPLAQAIVVAIALRILLELLGAVNTLVAISALRRVLAGQHFEMAELTAVDQRTRLVVGATSVVSFVAFVVFCFFLPRANRNVRSFGVGPLKFSPGGTVGWMFVPFVNLYAPYQAMKEIWQGSAIRWEVSPWYERVSSLLPWWWGMYLTSNIVAGVLGAIFGQAKGAEAFINKCWADLVKVALGVVSAVLFVALVRALARRQDERQRHRPIDTEHPVTAGAAP
jgi:hypothetical protein